MQQAGTEIVIVIAAGTALLLLLVVFLFIFMMLYQKKTFKHLLEKAAWQQEFTREILKSRLEVQEQTFLTISREIHDNIGQILSLVRLNLSTLETTPPTGAAGKIAVSKELIDQAIQDLRDLSRQLNSEYLTQQSLPDLLRFQLNLLQKSGVFKTNFLMQGPERQFSQDQKLIIFRIAQEALNNAIKHSEAENIDITLNFLPEKTVLKISDDGVGFDIAGQPQEDISPKGLGTYNLRNRATLIGGQATLTSKPGQGTQVEVIIPVSS